MTILNNNEISNIIWYAMGVTEGASNPFSISIAGINGYPSLGTSPAENSG